MSCFHVETEKCRKLDWGFDLAVRGRPENIWYFWVLNKIKIIIIISLFILNFPFSKSKVQHLSLKGIDVKIPATRKQLKSSVISHKCTDRESAHDLKVLELTFLATQQVFWKFMIFTDNIDMLPTCWYHFQLRLYLSSKPWSGKHTSIKAIMLTQIAFPKFKWNIRFKKLDTT